VQIAQIGHDLFAIHGARPRPGTLLHINLDVARERTVPQSLALDLIKHFGELPDDAVVPPKVVAAVLGVSEWTIRRNPPVPFIALSVRRRGARVGTIRALVRGQPVPTNKSVGPA
jgi:hypothetical protein